MESLFESNDQGILCALADVVFNAVPSGENLALASFFYTVDNEMLATVCTGGALCLSHCENYSGMVFHVSYAPAIDLFYAPRVFLRVLGFSSLNRVNLANSLSRNVCIA